MPKQSIRAALRSGGDVVGAAIPAIRIAVVALAITIFTALAFPGQTGLWGELGATAAFAKNDRNGDRGRGGERGRGHARGHDKDTEAVTARGGNNGRTIWNRPRQRQRVNTGRREELHRYRDAEAPPVPPRRPDVAEREFRNHGDRVSTFVALAKSLGLGASTGAMQANFGTPFENGLVATDPDTGEFLKDPDTGEFIIDATDEEIAAVKPGSGPKSGWETATELDVNMDGVVDRLDLISAQGGAAPTGGEMPEDNVGGKESVAVLRQ